MIFPCPACGATNDLAVCVAHEDARAFHGVLLQLPDTLIKPTIKYLGLFRPEKTRLQWGRMVTIVRDLLPMIQDCKVQYGHATYTVPHAMWVAAITGLVESPPASLKLPLKSNGYLLALIAGQCEQAEAKAEAARIEKARNRSQPAGRRAVDQGNAGAMIESRESAPPLNPGFAASCGKNVWGPGQCHLDGGLIPKGDGGVCDSRQEI